MRKIAILGYATPSLWRAPFNDPSWEIWGLNQLYTQIPRWDRWFELHSREVCERIPDSAAYAKWLKEQTKPIYMIQQYTDIPACVPYPKDAILKQFGGYFNNTISWQIALALHEGVDRIGLYGVDMAIGTEYSHQRPSCEYFIGMARGMGVQVDIPVECDLLKTAYLYGFEDEPEVLLRLQSQREELRTRQRQAQAAKADAQHIESYNQGAIDSFDMVLKNWGYY